MPRKLAKIVAALAPLPALAAAGEALGQNPAHTFRFAEVDFAVIRFDPAKENLRLAWLGADGVPLSTYENLEKALNAEGKRIKFALNSRIYAGWEEPGGQAKKMRPASRFTGLWVCTCRAGRNSCRSTATSRRRIRRNGATFTSRRTVCFSSVQTAKRA
ncbi:MAG: hypothetical protein R3F11_31680 [Verrucomicrobiales bacterium]